MAEYRVELTGWKAIAALVLILAVSGFRVYSRVQTVPDDGRAAVRDWLVKDYEGFGPAQLAQRIADYRAGVRDLPSRPATPSDVQFVSLTAHGWRNSMVVRAEVTVEGGPPSDGRSVRYVFLTTKVGGGWMVLSDSDSYRYYTALFD